MAVLYELLAGRAVAQPAPLAEVRL
jgi:hypothetical protein